MYNFKCDVHDHMTSFVATINHPYYAVSDESGHFTINNVPAGNYTVKAWHEALGKLEKTVVVETGKTAQVSFEILPID